jgi:Ca2+-binding RTX toxin-like protein
VTGSKITVRGGSGGNTVNGAAVTGASVIVAVGGAGKDVFTGGAGNDIFEFTAAGLAASDMVVGGAGTDKLVMTAAGTVNAGGVGGVEVYELADGTNKLTLANANFTAAAGGKITVDGGGGADTVNASAVTGSSQVALVGGAGNDVLTAGQHATMTGGAGADVFGLTTLGTLAAPDTNTIADFTHSTDKITFSDAGFSLGLSGASSTLHSLPTTLFTSNATGSFNSAADRFAYDTANGALYYDSHGNTAGSSRQHIATLTGHPTLTAGDLFFVS